MRCGGRGRCGRRWRRACGAGRARHAPRFPLQLERARTFTREKKKSQALMCLKKKKMYEQQLERLDALVSRRGEGGGVWGGRL